MAAQHQRAAAYAALQKDVVRIVPQQSVSHSSSGSGLNLLPVPSHTTARALVHAGFVLPYSGATAPGFHGVLSLRATQ